jgi:PAS domain S-box-containing protein
VRRRLRGYALATAALVLALLIRWLLDPMLGTSLPLVTSFGAVAASVWVAGCLPASVIAVVGYFAFSFLFIPPRGTFNFGSFADVVGMLAYLFTCSLIIGIGEAMRAAKARANQQRDTLRVTLASIGDAVITTDTKGRITYLNGVAESLTGWTVKEAVGRPVQAVFLIANEETRQPVPNPVTRALERGTVGLADHTVLVRKNGGEVPIDDRASPIRDDNAQVSGCVLTFRDVTAQRRDAQEKASQLLTARRLASIVECSDDGIISKSLGGIIQSWNAGAERLFGYTSAEAIGHHISLVIPPECLSEEDHIIRTLKAGERIDHFETERLRKDGRRLRVSLTVSPIRDEAGNIVGASKIIRDVTLQRRAEERERELLAETAAANAKFQAFFEQGALFAGLLNLDGTVIEVNRLSWQGCGFTREQALGKPFWEGPWWAPSPALTEQIRAGFAQAIAGTTFRAEVPYFVGDGSQRIADVTIVPIKDGTGKVLFAAPTGIDITDRKRAEAGRQQFVTLVENSTDFIGICDLKGVPLFINRAGLDLVGLADIEEARQKPLSDFFFREDRAAIVERFFPAVLERGGGEIEVRFRNFKTGAARWMAYKVLTLPDADGRPIALATVSQDVTERRQMADDLRRVAADLSEANHRQTEFLAMLAHELRNPLAPISNAVRALRVGNGDAKVARAVLGMFERQVSQLARLVDDLLDLSRVTRGKIALRREVVELGPIVEQAVEAVRAQYGGLDHELSVTLPTEPVYLDADPARVAQVLGNLLNNACKFTDRGGHIALSVTNEGPQAVVRVRDDGIGIAPEQIPHLFRMFAQADTSLERTRDGLGIGLTLVKALVEMHGGTTGARSEGLGRGSEFEVRLPVLADASAAVPRAARMQPTRTAGHRILIVDDNLDGAESLAMLLEEVGQETFEAHDGLQALDAAERVRPDAILLDIGLPKLNGYEVCRRIRQRPWGGKLMIVAMTGWGQEEDRQRSIEAGFDSHLVKPVDFDLLMKLLDSLPAPSGPIGTAPGGDGSGDLRAAKGHA